MVLLGLGFTLLGPMALESDSNTGQLKVARLIQPEIPRVLALTAQHVRPASQAQQAVSNLIADQVSQFPREFFDPLKEGHLLFNQA
jgi:hypothetical protein